MYTLALCLPDGRPTDRLHEFVLTSKPYTIGSGDTVNMKVRKSKYADVVRERHCEIFRGAAELARQVFLKVYADAFVALDDVVVTPGQSPVLLPSGSRIRLGKEGPIVSFAEMSKMEIERFMAKRNAKRIAEGREPKDVAAVMQGLEPVLHTSARRRLTYTPQESHVSQSTQSEFVPSSFRHSLSRGEEHTHEPEELSLLEASANLLEHFAERTEKSRPNSVNSSFSDARRSLRAREEKDAVETDKDAVDSDKTEKRQIVLGQLEEEQLTIDPCHCTLATEKPTERSPPKVTKTVETEEHEGKEEGTGNPCQRHPMDREGRVEEEEEEEKEDSMEVDEDEELATPSSRKERLSKQCHVYSEETEGKNTQGDEMEVKETPTPRRNTPRNKGMKRARSSDAKDTRPTKKSRETNEILQMTANVRFQGDKPKANHALRKKLNDPTGSFAHAAATIILHSKSMRTAKKEAIGRVKEHAPKPSRPRTLAEETQYAKKTHKAAKGREATKEAMHKKLVEDVQETLSFSREELANHKMGSFLIGKRRRGRHEAAVCEVGMDEGDEVHKKKKDVKKEKKDKRKSSSKEEDEQEIKKPSFYTQQQEMLEMTKQSVIADLKSARQLRLASKMRDISRKSAKRSVPMNDAVPRGEAREKRATRSKKAVIVEPEKVKRTVRSGKVEKSSRAPAKPPHTVAKRAPSLRNKKREEREEAKEDEEIGVDEAMEQIKEVLRESDEIEVQRSQGDAMEIVECDKTVEKEVEDVEVAKESGREAENQGEKASIGRPAANVQVEEVAAENVALQKIGAEKQAVEETIEPEHAPSTSIVLHGEGPVLARPPPSLSPIEQRSPTSSPRHSPRKHARSVTLLPQVVEAPAPPPRDFFENSTMNPHQVLSEIFTTWPGLHTVHELHQYFERHYYSLDRESLMRMLASGSKKFLYLKMGAGDKAVYTISPHLARPDM